MIPAQPRPAPVYAEDDISLDVGYDYRTVISPYQIPLCCTLKHFPKPRVRLSHKR
jgi:hypothetical protein